MVSFGLIDSWQPAAGDVTWWAPTPQSRLVAAQAPIDPTPPAHIQQAYLRSAHENREAGFRFSRLCLLNFDISGALDHAAMGRALTRLVRRHDTFRYWFATTTDDITRHRVDPEQIELQMSSIGWVDSADEIRDYVQQVTPGPDVWECFGFGTIERDGMFTVCAAMDHLVTDGISQAIEIFDIRELYRDELGDPDAQVVADVGSYLDYCVRERTATATLTLDSEPIRRWVEIVQENGGDLPTFPMDLGKDAEGYTRTRGAMFPLISGEQAAAVDAACAGTGAKFSGAVFAAAAIAQYELSGQQHYLGLTPVSTRTNASEWMTVGWFSSLVPLPFDVAAGDSFVQVAARAQEVFAAAKQLGEVPYHRVLELVTPDMGIHTKPGWTVPMMSYVDVRKLPGAELLAAINVGLWGSRGSSEEVFTWINRFDEEVSTTVLYPGTDVADEAMVSYASTLARIFLAVAEHGDYTVQAPTS